MDCGARTSAAQGVSIHGKEREDGKELPCLEKINEVGNKDISAYLYFLKTLVLISLDYMDYFVKILCDYGKYNHG